MVKMSCLKRLVRPRSMGPVEKKTSLKDISSGPPLADSHSSLHTASAGGLGHDQELQWVWRGRAPPLAHSQPEDHQRPPLFRGDGYGTGVETCNGDVSCLLFLHNSASHKHMVSFHKAPSTVGLSMSSPAAVGLRWVIPGTIDSRSGSNTDCRATLTRCTSGLGLVRGRGASFPKRVIQWPAPVRRRKGCPRITSVLSAVSAMMKFTLIIWFPLRTGAVISPRTARPPGPTPCRTSAVQ